MKTLKIRDAENNELDIVLNVTKYVIDNSLAIQMKYVEEDGNILPYAMLTVNFSGVNSTGKDCAFVDVNNLGDGIVIWIKENNLGEFTGRRYTSGHITYPEIEFDMDKVKEYAEHFIEVTSDCHAKEVPLSETECEESTSSSSYGDGDNIIIEFTEDEVDEDDYLLDIVHKSDFEHNAAITLDVWGTPDSVPKAVLDFIANEMPVSFLARLLDEKEGYVIDLLKGPREHLYKNIAAAYMETPCDEFCRDFLPELQEAIGNYHKKKKSTIKVKAVWEFEFNKGGLDSRIVDVEDVAIDAARTRLATLFLEGNIASKDFKFVVEKDDDDVM